MNKARPEARRAAPRAVLLGGAVLLLLAALWGGWLRLGWAWPGLRPSLVGAHGPLMVAGFLGTLIGVERAVALGRAWAYLPPGLCALGGLLLIGGLALPGALCISLGSLGLVLVFGLIVRRQTALYTLTMAAGTLLWLAGNLLWLAGRPIFEAAPWWAGFLILTIAGERLELGRLARLSPAAERLFVLAGGVFTAGLLAGLFDRTGGARLLGAGMLALAAWLSRYDIARRTIFRPGLPRYAAICLLAGYAWLAASGAFSLLFGAQSAGFRYDAILHAVFVGCVLSMIFGHAPIIFPAVLGLPIRFWSGLYLPLGLLHASLLLRIAGDLLAAPSLRMWGGLFNGVALLLFFGLNGWTMARR